MRLLELDSEDSLSVTKELDGIHDYAVAENDTELIDGLDWMNEEAKKLGITYEAMFVKIISSWRATQWMRNKDA